mmetsp:Transcript_14680/g.14780  ORF Transcript_14680/g.14780 Transcript_14680/m.14780 type:complete len:433 (-) Transcript_14680:235-1533(-)|eukprot:CAMPEP_0182425246 /NCGR_PEP_ID=MMETSP1167-20130531/11603_1 /TAXON_ID=2988 /ORGANISM="Mallomonas Sp, Strain CCMP3275" /LENGTH=432 /DNA_ID=CAMNT_0024605745 /DNA_START=98 /DNA_END=1396 /DNA_ORIENTATION=-
MAELVNKKVDKIVNEDDDDDDEQEMPPLEEPKKEEEEDTSLANSDVTTKYQEASKIAQSTLLDIISLAVPGTSIVEICRAGDQMIVQRASLIFRAKQKSKHIEKGIAFPVCISVNECVCHNSPLTTEASVTLKEDDMIKIDLGVHVDGYISVVAHTHIVRTPVPVPEGDTPPPPPPPPVVTGPRANTMNAAYTAAELAARLIKPGNTNKQVTEAIKKVAEIYGVNLIAGTVMHQMKRYIIDGNKMIILREEGDQKAEDCTFEQFEVYAVDVAMTSGDGKPREGDARTTVYKRAVDKTYKMKMKASRAFYSEVSKRFPTLPFTLRAFDDERSARMGVRECVNHQLLLPYPVLYERPGDVIAHIKFTVLLLQSGTVKVTGIALSDNSTQYVSDNIPPLPEDLQTILSATTVVKKKKKRNNKKKTSGGEKDEEEA